MTDRERSDRNGSGERQRSKADRLEVENDGQRILIVVATISWREIRMDQSSRALGQAAPVFEKGLAEQIQIIVEIAQLLFA